MKFLLLILLALGPVTVMAQAPGARPTPKPTFDEGVAAFAVRAPDEGSPFFSEREMARVAMAQQGRQQVRTDTVAVYPRVKDSPDSASGMLKSFFTEMFSSINWRGLRTEQTTEKLQIEPENFSLQDRNEVGVVYTVRNNTGKIIRLDYATTQRIDLETTDGSGKVLEKWSNDRAFEPQEGIVIINPKERIEYRENVPTRDMKAGETYGIKAEVTGYPDYTVIRTVTPAP